MRVLGHECDRSPAACDPCDEMCAELTRLRAKCESRLGKNPCVLQGTHCVTHDRGYAFCFSEALDRLEKAESEVAALKAEREAMLARVVAVIEANGHKAGCDCYACQYTLGDAIARVEFAFAAKPEQEKP